MLAVVVVVLYTQFVHCGVPSVSDEELNTFLSLLYVEDDQRPLTGEVIVNFQQRVDQANLSDSSNEKFITFVKPQLLEKPLYRKFIALFDNYIPANGANEEYSEHKRNEINAFANELARTTVFNMAYEFLHTLGHPHAQSKRVLKEALKSLWFTNYIRYKGTADSSSFEHVFIGESLRKRGKKRRASGMHNWIRFFELEHAGDVDYAGYVLKRQTLAVIAFKWQHVWQSIGGFMLGTSPAYDLIVYTVCFWLRPNSRKCKFRINQCALSIHNYVIQRNGTKYVGTAFPTPGKANAACRRASKNV